VDSSGLSHLDSSGAARMVDISEKPTTSRRATASARITLNVEAYCAIRDNTLSKGDAIPVARIAGILAAKRVDELIPLCHTLSLSSVDIAFDFVEPTITVTATAATVAQTGVEMEAMIAATTAALTIYDMAKSLDRGIIIDDVKVVRKEGGRSGAYQIDGAY
jgi:cyclic pyranopterin phosphate synthase